MFCLNLKYFQEQGNITFEIVEDTVCVTEPLRQLLILSLLLDKTLKICLELQAHSLR